MQISDLFQRLSYGELSNLSISSDGSGTLAEASHPRVIQYANQALLRLYSRFLLKESNLLISMLENRTMYRLDKKHSVTNPGVGEDIYIQDTAENPFQNDVIRILSVFDQNGLELPLNDAENPASAFTPQPNVVQIVTPVGGAPLGITYQARHIPLVPTTLTQTIDLPETLDEALTALIAYYYFRDINTQESMASAQAHLARYEMIVAEVTDRDVVNETVSTTSSRFSRNGWV